jgi:very-short-patch-repair endonuclease
MVKKTIKVKGLKNVIKPKRAVKSKNKVIKTVAEDLLYTQLQEALPTVEFVREHKGIPGRQFRFDFASIALQLAIEVQGGVFTYGGHSTGMGITRDCEKLALSNLAGWTVFQVTSGQVRDGTAIKWINEWCKGMK